MHTSGSFIFDDEVDDNLGDVDYSTTFGGAGWHPVAGVWTPEPATLLLMAGGGLMAIRRRRQG